MGIHSQRRLAATFAAACVIALQGCDSTSLTFQGLGEPPPVRDLATPALLNALDQDGHFRLPAPDPGQGLEISTARAAELAIAYVQTFGPYIRTFLERGHGASIDFDALQPGRVYYAISPYAPVPEPAHPGAQKGLGPYYVVHLLSNGQHALSVAVSSLSTDVAIVDGRIRYPIRSGNDFLAIGIPRGGGEQRPMSPEQAAQIVFDSTGLRIAALPRLVLAGRPFEPQEARWRITMERAASFLGTESDRRITTTDVYVDFQGGLYVPRAEQPGGITAIVDRDEVSGYIRKNVPLTGEVPTSLERVELVGRKGRLP